MRKLLALLAACTVIVACDSARSTGLQSPPGAAEVGTFVLRSVSGISLPYMLAPTAPNTTRQLIADTLTIGTGGIIREIYHTSTTPTGGTASVSSVALTGTYTVTRDSLTLPADFPYVSGRYAADSVSLRTANGFVYVFTRR
jgi:hypothetical protein